MENKPPPRIILPKAEPGESSESPTLDSIAAGGEQPAKRRCISSACMPCRRRKSKASEAFLKDGEDLQCDGVKPACNACTSVYGSECYYDIDSDHRRKGALKRDIAQLKEELSAQNTILDAIKKGFDSDVDDIIQLLRANLDESYDSIAESIQKMTIAKLKSESSSGGLEGELADFTVKPSSDKTGEVGHYGHTSNLTLGLDAEQPPIAGDQLGSWTNVTNDTELVNHLLDVYFAWQHPFYLLFSEETFYHGLRDRKLKYCTPLLVNAVLAVACHFSDRPEIRSNPGDPNTVGSHFFDEAKRLLREDERSSLTTVQALGLMSLQQAMSSRDQNGWQYAGQMMSMSVQLSLHMPAPPNAEMTPSEIEARRVTFWGVFLLETAWALCVGRISSLPQAAIRLEKPSLLPHLENRPWKPDGLPNYNGKSASLEQPSFKYSMLVHNSILSELVNDIVHMFYAPKDRITSRKLHQHHEKLQLWYKNLPEGLQVNKHGPTLPQVLTLHIYYHNCVLHLFRPFLKVSFVQNVKSPRQICTETANEISHLTSVFSQTYGMRRMYFMVTHCLMSAAIVHLVNISSTTPAMNPSMKEQQEIFLADAIRGLHAMQPSFQVVSRYLKSIKTLIHKWCSVIPTRVQEAMTDIEMGSPNIAPTNSPTCTSSNVENMQLPDGSTSETIHEAINYTNTSTFHTPEERKHSAPDLVQMAPPPHPRSNPPSHISLPQHNNNATNGAVTLSNSYQQQLFWTPFPDEFDGVPLAVNGGNENSGTGQGGAMGITGMMDGEFPLLNQDGFLVSGEGFNVWDGDDYLGG